MSCLCCASMFVFFCLKWHSMSDCMSLIHSFVHFLDQFSNCSRRHADCLAFPGGRAQALTRSVWLCSAVPGALDSARSAPQRPASLLSSLSLFSFSQFLHRLPGSAPLCQPIYQRELLSWLLGAAVGKRWKRCLRARKNLQLCFILYRTGCCSCRCRSASAAASHQIFSPAHKKTCLLPVLQKHPPRRHQVRWYHTYVTDLWVYCQTSRLDWPPFE